MGESIWATECQTPQRNPQARASDAQAMTALGTARIDHFAATLGSHANQEAVGTLATDYRRLISAFHDFSLKQHLRRNARLEILSRYLSRTNVSGPVDKPVLNKVKFAAMTSRKHIQKGRSPLPPCTDCQTAGPVSHSASVGVLDNRHFTVPQP